MNTVFTNIAGQGEPLLVLHGWGMNHQIWSSVKAGLERSFRVTWVDLPGHGKSKGCALGELDQAVEQIIPLLDKPMHILGWSLGGLVAQRLAECFPESVRSLILVATSPSFVCRKKWKHAMPVNVLQGFIDSFEKDYQSTIQRFLALQFMGVKGVKLVVKQLKNDLLASPPDQQALHDGLALLLNADLRNTSITCPQHWILGRLDKLVPVTVASDLSAMKNSSVFIMKESGHAPFISHPELFVTNVCETLLAVSESE